MLVDGAILDVSNFSQRHPGGARLILNAVGTDVTQELLGEDMSVGHAMSFTPHRHPEVCSILLFEKNIQGLYKDIEAYSFALSILWGSSNIPD